MRAPNWLDDLRRLSTPDEEAAGVAAIGGHRAEATSGRVRTTTSSACLEVRLIRQEWQVWRHDGIGLDPAL